MEELTAQSYMKIALEQAKLAEAKGEVPVGAIVVYEGRVVAKAHNLRETNNDPTAHAEILALRAAGKELNRWNLTDCDLYVTLEPCLMCAGAIVYSRIRKVYFGAYDLRFGCLGTVENFAADTRFNHRAETEGGVLHDECLKPITDFFKARRK